MDSYDLRVSFTHAIKSFSKNHLKLRQGFSKLHSRKILTTTTSLILVFSLVVSSLSSQIGPVYAAPSTIYKIQSGLVASDSLTTGDFTNWGIGGSADDPGVNAPHSATEDLTGFHIGTVAPSAGVWSGWFAITPDTEAHLFHATIKLPDATPQTGLYDAAVYVQQEMFQDPRIDAMGCGADVFPTEYHWTVSLQAGDATHEIVNQSIYTDTSPNQPRTRECTLITNGSNQLTAYIDGQKVFSSNKMNLNMPEPFQYYLEIQTNSNTPSVGTQFIPTFTDYYATTSEFIKVKAAGANSIVRVVDASTGNTLGSANADATGTALVDVGRYHMPINANVVVYDASATNILAQTSAPAGIYGGDVFNVGSATAQQASITVQSTGISIPVSGMYTTIRKGTFSDFGFTPVTFSSLSQDAPYIVSVSNYATHIFDHWEDGSRISGRVFTPITTASTLTATYRESDVTNPPTSLSSTTQYTTNINTPTIIGTAVGGSTIRLYDGATTIGSPATASATGQWSIATPALTNGQHLFSATSAVGTNVSPPSSALTMTVDQVLPSVLITGNTVSNNQVTLTGTSSDAGSGIKAIEISIDNSATFTKTTPVVQADWSNWIFTTGTLTVGSHHFIARATDLAGNQNTNAVDVNVTNSPPLTTTTTVLSSSVNPSAQGQSVTFTATVTGAGGTPTGTVSFRDGITVIGTGTLAGGVATLTTNTLTVGTHSITAVYSGDTVFNTSTSTALTQTVNSTGPTASSTSLTSNTNPSVFGQSVTFTATVTGTGGTPTGTVTFRDGAVTLGTGTIAGGVATFSTNTLTVGTHSITASYSGDANFASSTSAAITQTVNKGNTTTTLTSSINPSVFGQSVTFTATVSTAAPATGTRTGTVSFFDGATNIGTGTLTGGVASLTITTLGVGTHSITASYSGDVNFNVSTSAALTQAVNKGNTTTALTSSINPSSVGQSITFTATVSAVAPAAGTRTGTVTFFDGATNIGTGTLTGGITTLATSSLTGGSHSITASYSGDVNFNVSTSAALTQTVKVASTTALTSSVNPSSVGQSITFTATVTGTGGTPTGTVTFLDGATTLGTGTLVNGVTTFSTTSLAGGTHNITASYGGNAIYNTSTSPALTQTVNKLGSTTTVTANNNPSVFGQSVTFTATVTGTGGTPTGTVTFRDGAATLGTGTLASGMATFSTTTLGVGSHSITASYAGDVNYNASTSATLTQTVNKGSTLTTVSTNHNPAKSRQSITFTATVSTVAPATGTRTGTVTFFDGATNIGTGTLTGNVATLSKTSLAVGTHNITAVYSGDANFNTSTSAILVQTIK